VLAVLTLMGDLANYHGDVIDFDSPMIRLFYTRPAITCVNDIDDDKEECHVIANVDNNNNDDGGEDRLGGGGGGKGGRLLREDLSNANLVVAGDGLLMYAVQVFSGPFVIDRGSSPYLASLECICDDVHLTTVQADGSYPTRPPARPRSPGRLGDPWCTPPCPLSSLHPYAPTSYPSDRWFSPTTWF
ncbi:hypothetical protein ACHAXA_007984, partial [Cyclostephanos tholiformis]